ncbi:hypothetical protein F4818DRAFT_278926 [Hypoxylon cercidicola]|nr:hypothetical protein F4818DRAFT_278926 [Hypoxylon cercidicola]
MPQSLGARSYWHGDPSIGQGSRICGHNADRAAECSRCLVDQATAPRLGIPERTNLLCVQRYDIQLGSRIKVDQNFNTNLIGYVVRNPEIIKRLGVGYSFMHGCHQVDIIGGLEHPNLIPFPTRTYSSLLRLDDSTQRAFEGLILKSRRSIDRHEGINRRHRRSGSASKIQQCFVCHSNTIYWRRSIKWKEIIRMPDGRSGFFFFITPSAIIVHLTL